MDRGKDIGPICNFYSNNNEIYNSENKNNSRIDDIEKSINASLLDNNKETNICYERKYNLYNFCVVVTGLGVLLILIYVVFIYII